MNIHKKKGSGDTKLELQIAPLIDVVFLLLIYFMVTASLVRKEGDVPFLLPAKVDGIPPIMMPVEAVIQIYDDNTVELEGMRFGVNDRTLGELTNHIKGLQQMADSQGTKFFVNLLPDEDALHVRIVDVMDACAMAKVDTLTFSPNL